MNRCAAVFVELGERPELDRLRRCSLDRCADHPVQLGWVRADPARLAAYNQQLRRYDLGQQVERAAEELRQAEQAKQIGTQAEQASLL